MLKKAMSVLLAALLLVGCQTAPTTKPTTKNETTSSAQNVQALPVPSKVEGSFKAEDSNINKTNLVKYLGRGDIAFIDLRDYSDYTKKHLKNFEVIPFFGLIYNAKAGEAGFPQLYKGTHAEPVNVYKESDQILQAMIPKDRTVFLMCQGGARVEMLMKILKAKGYDMSKIYNVGGMANYTGEAFTPWVTDLEEAVVEAKYRFEGLTPVK
ncbi:hypothetical protein ABB02_00850 [Clostridiaceae bacterium JG1575]|nr:hypothetical protein ABB02_00850 [Clostridiaceae bacterium JG1575]